MGIATCSHITNNKARANVRTYLDDFACGISHNRNMARRGIPKQVNWYLREWWDAAFPGRGAQAKMSKLTGWSKATTSQLYNNDQDYSPKIVNEAAQALHVEPWELFMPPERAMQFRRLRAELAKLARDTTLEEDLSYLDSPDFIRKVVDNDKPTNSNDDENGDPDTRGTGTHG